MSSNDNNKVFQNRQYSTSRLETLYETEQLEYFRLFFSYARHMFLSLHVSF